MEDYKVLGRREEEVARLRAEAEELVKVAHAGTEQLENDRAALEKQKQTEEWVATAELKQELTNAKAANAAMGKEKAAAEAIAVKAVEAEARLAKALEGAKEPGARAAKVEVQTREAQLAEITARVTVAEKRANDAVEIVKVIMVIRGCNPVLVIV
ncbi:uncharacterized protein LOC110900624 [Helianthus annuus]|uniref:uncharacterized protein LOC110900624 n=1 Tax=Helianthus annuus TaxID=4232 RepID=UPI000B904538|nr:uncharacterized protein LOC110900624 [Helianthus annuus]